MKIEGHTNQFDGDLILFFRPVGRLRVAKQSTLKCERFLEAHFGGLNVCRQCPQVSERRDTMGNERYERMELLSVEE